MKALDMPTPHCRPDDCPRSPGWNAKDHSESVAEATGMRRVGLQVQLQSMKALLDVLVTVTRVGGKVESLAGEDGQLKLVAVARTQVARRLPQLLQQVITVVSVETFDAPQ